MSERDGGDRDRGFSYEAGRGAGERDRANKRTSEDEATQRVYLLRMDVESVATRTEKLAAIVQRDEWRAEHGSLKQAHAALVAEVKAHELDARASARAQAHYDAASGKLGELELTLEGAQEPSRPVPPVSGEEAIEPLIASCSAVPDDVLAWVAGLDARERSAISQRVKSVRESVSRIDTFAVGLANYLGGYRMLSQFNKVAANPREHFNPAAYAKARARREAADAPRADANASRTADAPIHNPQAADQKTTATQKDAAPPAASQVGRATTAKPTARTLPLKQTPPGIPAHADTGDPPDSLMASDGPPAERAALGAETGQVAGDALPPDEHAERAGELDAASPSSTGAPLPPGVRADMESALGADFSTVRVHQDGQAEAMDALAFTRGSDIHFAPGRYDPHGSAGRQLVGHELAHVAQQAQGRVSATTQVNGQAANDDPALEQEADAKGAQVATANRGAAALRTVKRLATAGPVQAKATPPIRDVSTGAQPMTSEPMDGAHRRADVMSDVTAAMPVQLQRDEGQPKKQHIPYKIQVTRPMTAEEFKIAAHLQMFGAVVPSDWRDVKDHYTPADSPVEIFVGMELFRRGRGAANAARGIETDAVGAIAGAGERTKEFDAQAGSDEKTAILTEIDRRYYAASGEAAGTKIRPGDTGRGELWRSVRDEVLFQRAYLGSLPDKVKAFIRAGIAGRELTPAEYDQLFRIAKKIENLPPGQAADYASKVTGQAGNLGELEAAIERYRSGVVAREHQDGERAEVHNKLLGLEEVYKLYRAYRATPAEAMAPGAREQLEQQLGRYGFASIGEFTSYITKYEQAFEDGAAAITLDILAKYAGKLHRESQRYQDPEVVKALHGKLGGFRSQYQEFDKNSKIESAEAWKAQHTHDAEVRRLPGNGGIPEKPPTRARVEARQKAEAARASAEVQINDLSKEYPIFAEDELPTDKRLNKVALAQASETELASVLQAHIALRQAAVAEARGQLEGKHELIYKMPKLMPTFCAQLGIQPGSIHDQIIQDKMHSDAVAKVVTGILVAIVTIALTVVSLGTATPAVLAAGASIGAAGISTYMAYDEYEQYTEEHAIAEAGFANDPSVVWLVLAVVGAGADMATAVSVVGKLAPAARTLGEAKAVGEADGKLIDFAQAVEKLKEAKEIDEKLAAAANKAAAARTSYAAAKDQLKADLKAAASGARGALGPFTDPTVFRGLVKMAIAKMREGVHSFETFIEQLKKARIEAQLGEMSPEELVKAKEAWARAESLSKQAKDPELLDKLLEHGVDPATIEQLTAKLDDTALRQLLDHGLPPAQIDRLSKMTEPQVKRLLALSGDQVAAFVGLPDAALARYAGFADNVFMKFAGLDAAGIGQFGALSDAAFAKFAALDAPMLRSFGALDVETLRSFAFFDDAVLRRFGSIPPTDLAKLTGIDTIALRDFEAMDEKALRELLANHSTEDIRVFGNMTPQKWAEAHASAASLDADGGHSFAKHGAHTTMAQQETRLRTGVAPDGSVMTEPADKAGRFASDAAQVEAAKIAERDLYKNMVGTKGKLKKEYVAEFEVKGAGYSYRLDPPGIPPPPYLGGRVVEDLCHRVHVLWRLNPAGTDYILVTMYPVR